MQRGPWLRDQLVGVRNVTGWFLEWPLDGGEGGDDGGPLLVACVLWVLSLSLFTLAALKLAERWLRVASAGYFSERWQRELTAIAIHPAGRGAVVVMLVNVSTLFVSLPLALAGERCGGCGRCAICFCACGHMHLNTRARVNMCSRM